MVASWPATVGAHVRGDTFLQSDPILKFGMRALMELAPVYDAFQDFARTMGDDCKFSLTGGNTQRK